jgi:hypothetical protein
MNTYEEAAMYSAEALEYYRSINREAPVKRLYHIYHKNKSNSEFSYWWSLWMCEWEAESFIQTFYLPVLNEDVYGYRPANFPLTLFDGRDIDYYTKGLFTDHSNIGYTVMEGITYGAQDVYAVAMIRHDTYVEQHPDDRTEDDFPGIVELIDRINAGEKITTISVL